MSDNYCIELIYNYYILFGMTEATTTLPDDSQFPGSVLIVITSTCFTVLCLLVHVYIVCGEVCRIIKTMHTNAFNNVRLSYL